MKDDQPSSELLRVEQLHVELCSRGRSARIVDNLNLTIDAGEIVALVGESGSGKSVTALALMRLLQSPPFQFSGRVWLEGTDILALSNREMARLRGQSISMVFQDPLSSLDPLFRVGSQLTETVLAHENVGKQTARDMGVDSLKRVGIPDPERRMQAYPHELSGGMRQRVMIAQSILLPPRLLIADEPTTALDVTVQAQILDLIVDLQREFNMAVLLITHNLALASEYAHRIMVMYAGEIVESGPTDHMLSSPQHPYTQGLIDCIPTLDRVVPILQAIGGSVPNPRQLPTGCHFHPRCRYRLDVCTQEDPDLEDVGHERSLRCWNPQAYVAH
jgi:oligopeptide/dipeptide ABC transporter ATP-binding protein